MSSKQRVEQPHVYVALSGGVDSAVAAALLLRKGYAVTGVYMRQYDSELGQSDGGRQIECGWQQDRRDAISVAAHLDIPFREWDFRKEYHKEVVDYMVAEYKAGRTPNPDVMCNTHIKFGAFLQKALAEGADYIATGHYVTIEDGQLLQAVDRNKDQTYFLWGLTPSQLSHCLFPIGAYQKTQVRVLAKKWGIPTAAKKDSQGVCFIGKISMQEFLKSKIKPKKGLLMTLDGNIVGEHDGAWYYTIGQRHGIGFKGGSEGYEVVDKDVKKNIVYVGRLGDDEKYNKISVEFDTVNWLISPRMIPFKCKARVRYRQVLMSCTVEKVHSDTYRAIFTEPQRAITPGQAIVMYKGQKMVGGGIII